MSSNRTILLKNLRELPALVSNLDGTVQTLKDLQITLQTTDENLLLKEIEASKRLENLEKELRDNGLSAVIKSAKEFGRIVVTQTDIDELTDENKDLRETMTKRVNEKVNNTLEMIQLKVENESKLTELRNEKQVALLELELKHKDIEIQLLKEKLELMSTARDVHRDVPVPNIQISQPSF
jgi:hypothetical protein